MTTMETVRWIEVDVEKPIAGQVVMLWGSHGQDSGWYDGDGWIRSDDPTTRVEGVTYWAERLSGPYPNP